MVKIIFWGRDESNEGKKTQEMGVISTGRAFTFFLPRKEGGVTVETAE
jgi:hypothetical protein